MHVTVVSDAWYPQVNGVVRTLATTAEHLRARGHRVTFVTPDRFRTVPCPTYPEIRLALFPDRRVADLLDAAHPCAIHIATEGPLGHAARRYCLARGLPFTTAYHTKFPEYLQARAGIPLAWTYRMMRRFHAPSSGVMVATASLRRELEAHGFANLRDWTRGVDVRLFHPRPSILDLPGPILMYVGRVAVEKNIGAFLALDHPGTKVVVGDGPQRAELMRQHPDVVFVGAKSGEDLAAHYASADVFVFPSRTDTFGLVLIEALASGVPVAAYPVPGPLDVIADSGAGVLDEDLARAVAGALTIDRSVARTRGLQFTWARCAEMFLDNLQPFDPAEGQVRAA
ncbi:glycosyltransferase family 1 protein [Thalassobaculum sp. OXR-137]|uniref:glycosyltransferase family 4 protein n=1 Tax=Thalassobaculum sp. OXR-137 TaxID=3100173 RepID=UPI002AC94EA2|nr:glycosyltransferase family 1 protein [Thalassobaculum sp. OXR-137]WPZ37043.1 glycosyltransferase family 1 protein [Thalassobaculum sp. OXR-137]